MYSAQFTSFKLEPNYINAGILETQGIEQLAKEIAILTQGWGRLDIRSDEDTMLSAQTSSGTKIGTVEGFKTLSRTVADIAHTSPNQKGGHPSIALCKMAGTAPTPQPESASFADVEIPAELEKRPRILSVVRLPTPTQEVANSSPRELADAQSASPPYSPFFARTLLGK